MDMIFYIIIFMMGITFGSFYTLAVYRIPKGQDIIHTHSYCPKCNHKLNFVDLIPVFSYLLLKGKCRYCKEKIRPRYFLIEAISGIFFVLVSYLLGVSVFNLSIIKIIDVVFCFLYFTFIVLIAGIDKETRTINKSVLMYGIIISIMYIIYLYIIEGASIYRYVIYLIYLAILLLIDTIILRKYAKNNYMFSILILLTIMLIFTAEYVTLNTIITTLLIISIYLLSKKLKNNKSKQSIKQYNEDIKIGFLMAISNIAYFLIVLTYCKFI